MLAEAKLVLVDGEEMGTMRMRILVVVCCCCGTFLPSLIVPSKEPQSVNHRKVWYRVSGGKKEQELTSTCIRGAQLETSLDIKCL